jgi:hypothetical protein
MPRDVSYQEREKLRQQQAASRAARAALTARIRQTIDPRGVGGAEFLKYATGQAMRAMGQSGFSDHQIDKDTPARQEARAMASAQRSAAEITQAESRNNEKRTFGQSIKQPAARLALVAARARAGSLSRQSLAGRQSLRLK